MEADVPARLRNPANERVLRHVAEASAHGDLSEALARAVAPLGDVQEFCPDPQAYRYVVVSTQGIVFGFAIGMGTLGLRLDPTLHARALQTGGVDVPELGAGWVAFTLFRDDWPEVDVRFWARKAYAFARESARDAR